MKSVGQIFEQCFIERVHREQEGAYFIFGTIGFFANKIFDGNSVLLQSLHVSFLAVLVNLFVFKILCRHLDSSKAFKSAVLFAFFSPLFYYSPWILRDIHIVLLYVISFFIFNTDFNFKRLLLFIPLVLITLEFRFEHGVFLTFFPFLYFLLKGRSKYQYQTSVLVFSVFGVLFAGLIGFYFWSSANVIFSTLDRYSTATEESLSDGFSAYLYNLPVGLKQIAIVLHSQFTPLPPWGNFFIGKSLSQKISGLILIINTSFWSCVFLYLFYYFLVVKNVKYRLSRPLLFLLGVVVVFLVANSANMTVRRILVVYPILFLVFVSLKNEIVASKSKRIMRFSALTYTALLTLYLIVKYF